MGLLHDSAKGFTLDRMEAGNGILRTLSKLMITMTGQQINTAYFFLFPSKSSLLVVRKTEKMWHFAPFVSVIHALRKTEKMWHFAPFVSVTHALRKMEKCGTVFFWDQ